MNKEPKYRAFWIPTGEELKVGSICIDPLNNPYRYDGTKFETDDVFYPEKGLMYKFVPAKLYLCDTNKHVGGRIFNPATMECFVVPDETYITRTNDYAEDYNVVGAIDPNVILHPYTHIEEENIEGFMFGGGEDQLGYFVLKGISEENYIKLPNY